MVIAGCKQNVSGKISCIAITLNHRWICLSTSLCRGIFVTVGLCYHILAVEAKETNSPNIAPQQGMIHPWVAIVLRLRNPVLCCSHLETPIVGKLGLQFVEVLHLLQAALPSHTCSFPLSTVQPLVPFQLQKLKALLSSSWSPPIQSWKHLLSIIFLD